MAQCVSSIAKRLVSLWSFLILLSGVLFSQALSAQQLPTAVSLQRPLITETIDESRLTLLKGNTHRLARPEFDLGTAPATLPMQRMLLVLQRSPEQESALRKLLDDQQDKASSNYHKWLTPQQFGKQFGPTDADIQTITTWLQSHGFQVGSTKGRTVLEFSGSASQVREAFHTTIHKYIVNGEQHWANAGDPSIPAALSPAVAGVLTLHNFLKKPQVRISPQTASAKVRPGKRPALTFSDGSHGIAPLDFATIYNSPAYNAGPTGSGVTIGVIGRSNLFNGGEDVGDFRSSNAFGVCCGNFTVVLDGPDPGDLGGGDELEATLDSTWSGAVAPGASVDLVVSASTNSSDGIDLSEVYIVENNLADVMTESFSTCEAGNTSGQALGVSALAEQAAAQGITYFVSTGDSGAEGCDDPNSETVATSGLVSVNLLAATPFNVAVGGTVFNDTTNPALYWTSTNNGQESALSYIPEDVWNDSCLASTCSTNANIFAGSGGSSTFFTKPSWQAGVAGTDNMRDLPDVSLTAALHDGYVLCIEASCVPNSQGEFFLSLVGGTSASTPSFAGIMALVDQQLGRQGQANYVLYRLAASQSAILSQCNGSSSTLPSSTCIFHDVTIGNNAVPGELNYGSPTAQYQAAKGYDMATGLSSVNVTNLINQWNSVTFLATTTTLAPLPTTSIPHGTSVSVNISVAPSSGTGNPTGDVSILAFTGGNPSVAGTAVDGFTLGANSTVASSTSQLSGGTYNVYAHYAGDATFAPSDSAQQSVTVMQESSSTIVSVLTFDANGVQSNFTSGPFGSLVYVRADVVGGSGHGTPTGTVTFADTLNGAVTPIPGGNSFPLNSGDRFQNGSNTANPNGVFNFDTGTHTVSASYAGDASFSPSSSSPSITFTITPGFFVAASSNQPQVNISAPGASGSTSVSVSSSTGFKGTIALACSGLPTGAACTFAPASVTAAGTPQSTTSTITITTTAAAAAHLHPPHAPHLGWLALGTFLLFSFVVVGIPGRRRSTLAFATLLALLVLAPGCGGGSSHSSTPPPPPPATAAGTYNITVTATSGSTTSTTGFTLFVQ
jgi:subtilase family serine protease